MFIGAPAALHLGTDEVYWRIRTVAPITENRDLRLNGLSAQLSIDACTRISFIGATVQQRMRTDKPYWHKCNGACALINFIRTTVQRRMRTNKLDRRSGATLHPRQYTLSVQQRICTTSWPAAAP